MVALCKATNVKLKSNKQSRNYHGRNISHKGLIRNHLIFNNKDTGRNTSHTMLARKGDAQIHIEPSSGFDEDQVAIKCWWKNGMPPWICWLATVKILSIGSWRRAGGTGPIKPPLRPCSRETSSALRCGLIVLGRVPSSKLREALRNFTFFRVGNVPVNRLPWIQAMNGSRIRPCLIAHMHMPNCLSSRHPPYTGVIIEHFSNVLALPNTQWPLCLMHQQTNGQFRPLFGQESVQDITRTVPCHDRWVSMSFPSNENGHANLKTINAQVPKNWHWELLRTQISATHPALAFDMSQNKVPSGFLALIKTWNSWAAFSAFDGSHPTDTWCVAIGKTDISETQSARSEETHPWRQWRFTWPTFCSGTRNSSAWTTLDGQWH